MAVKNVTVRFAEAESVSFLEEEIKVLKKELSSRERRIKSLETKLFVSEIEERRIQDALTFYRMTRDAAIQYLDLYGDE